MMIIIPIPRFLSFFLSIFLSFFFVVSRLGKGTQWNKVHYLLTRGLQSDEYYKSRTVGVMSEVGLTTDRRPSELCLCFRLCLAVLQKHGVFILPRYRKSCGTCHYTTLWCVAYSLPSFSHLYSKQNGPSIFGGSSMFVTFEHMRSCFNLINLRIVLN